MPGWADTLFGGWTVSTLFQARSGNNLTPFFYELLHDEPLEHGQAARRPRQQLLLRVAAGPDQRPEHRRHARRVLRRDRLRACPPTASSATRRRAASAGPGTWVVNFGLYKDIVTKDRFRLQLSALLDNAFNHPQFFVGLRRTASPSSTTT